MCKQKKHMQLIKEKQSFIESKWQTLTGGFSPSRQFKPFIDQKFNKNKRPNKSGEKDE